jgi:hypothetical protein
MEILRIFLNSYNEGKSKSFFCITTTLFPIDLLYEIIEKASKQIKEGNIKLNDIRSKSKILKNLINHHANINNIDLKLRKQI